VAKQIRSVTVPMIARNLGIILWAFSSAVVCGLAACLLSPVSITAARNSERWWHKHVLVACGVEVITEGFERLDKNQRYIFIANHQSYFDIPVLSFGIKRHLSFVAKKELFNIPFFGWGMSAVGHVKIDRTNPRKARESITRAVSTLQQKNISLVLFPEGTRSLNGRLNDFKRASFTLALEAGVPIVPVAICGAWKINRKGSMRIVPGKVKLIITDPILPDVTQTMDKTQVAEKVHGIIAQTLDESLGAND